MGYWGEVARRAWRDAARAVKLDSRDLVLILVLLQIVIGFLLWLALGNENLPANLWARGAAIAAPFLLFVPLFLWKFVNVPAAIAAESKADHQRAEDVLNGRIEELEKKAPNPNERIERLIEVNSELLAQIANRETVPEVPVYLQDLRALTASAIRSRVQKTTYRMREMEHEFHSERDTILFGNREDWDEHTRRLIAQSRNQAHRWQSELRPEAVAMWNEMRRRIYGSAPYPEDHEAHIALEIGMLAGPSPLNAAAASLERLAREIPDGASPRSPA